MHRPEVGDTVRITVEALVTAVHPNGLAITVGAPLNTTLHRDHMCIVDYHEPEDRHDDLIETYPGSGIFE